jgi:hypothetical protein
MCPVASELCQPSRNQDIRRNHRCGVKRASHSLHVSTLSRQAEEKIAGSQAGRIPISCYSTIIYGSSSPDNPSGQTIAVSHPCGLLGPRSRSRPLQKFCLGSPRQYLGSQRVCFEPESSVLGNDNSHISERGAAILLGLSLADLRWFSRRAGLGQIESNSDNDQLFFTYDELAKLSAIAAPSAD